MADLGDIVLVRERNDNREWPAIVTYVQDERFITVVIFASKFDGGIKEGVVAQRDTEEESHRLRAVLLPSSRWIWRPKPPSKSTP